MYEPIPGDAVINQGDIIDDCPLVTLDDPAQVSDVEVRPHVTRSRVIILTQACDLAQAKTTRVVVAPVENAQSLVEHGILKATTIRDNIRRHTYFGLYFLPAWEDRVTFPESIVDLRDLHTLNREILQRLISEGKGVCRLTTPYREHLAQHFGVTYMRIGLPEPYETKS